MSIPFKDSPFKDRLPCFHANETDGKITCGCRPGLLHTSAFCEGCEEYYPVTNTFDFRDKSLKTVWQKEYFDVSYWYACSHCHSHVPMNSYHQEDFSPYCPNCGRKMYIEDTDEIEVPVGVYKHFKGKLYEVIGTAEHTETREKLVVYRALYGKFNLYVRPQKMFTEIVEDLEYHYRGPRFYRIEDIVEH